jgi:hypothetical protein
MCGGEQISRMRLWDCERKRFEVKGMVEVFFYWDFDNEYLVLSWTKKTKKKVSH